MDVDREEFCSRAFPPRALASFPSLCITDFHLLRLLPNCQAQTPSTGQLLRFTAQKGTSLFFMGKKTPFFLDYYCRARLFDQIDRTENSRLKKGPGCVKNRRGWKRGEEKAARGNASHLKQHSSSARCRAALFLLTWWCKETTQMIVYFLSFSSQME